MITAGGITQNAILGEVDLVMEIIDIEHNIYKVKQKFLLTDLLDKL